MAMTKMLYSASLERHMATYMQDVKLNELNQQYQLAQAQIVREGERMQVSQADIINKLDQLKAELKKQLEVKPAYIPVDEYYTTKTKSPPVQEKVEGKRPPRLQTTPKGTIIGLPEVTEAKQKLRKTPPKEATSKPKPPLQQALEEAAGSPSTAKAQTKSRRSSPTGSEATTVATTMATSANPSSPREDPGSSHFRRERSTLTKMIKKLVTNKQLSQESANDYLDMAKELKSVPAVNKLASDLTNRYDITANPSEFARKKKEIYKYMDSAEMKEKMKANPNRYQHLDSYIKEAEAMEDLYRAIQSFDLPFSGSGLKSKSKRKVSKRK